MTMAATMSDAPTMLVSGVTHVGRVRPHNEDAHFVDGEAGIALVCDGMGGHAAGEVASNMAVQLVRDKWTGPEVEHARLMWLRTRTPQARRNLLAAVKAAVVATNQAIIDESVSAHAASEDRDGQPAYVREAAPVEPPAFLAPPPFPPVRSRPKAAPRQRAHTFAQIGPSSDLFPAGRPG